MVCMIDMFKYIYLFIFQNIMKDTNQLDSKICYINLPNQILLRKSKWILLMIILRAIILWIILWIIIYWFIVLTYNISSENIWFKHTWWMILIFCIIYYFSTIISWFVWYYYDVVIWTPQKLYRFKLWLFFSDTVDVIELYRVQEMESKMDNFIKIFLNVWDLILIEPNDLKKIIHWIDQPKKVVLKFQELKDKFMEERKTVKLENKN